MDEHAQRILNLFIASPNDVAPERDAVEAVANRVAKRKSNLAIKVYRWEDGPPTLGEGPQEQVERSIPSFDALDIFVLILWQRYGTLLPDGISGTEREFRKAWAAHVEAGRPEILAYVCTVGSSVMDLVPDQVARLQAFAEDLRAKGVVKYYADRSQFVTIFEDHLQRLVDQIAQAERPSIRPAARPIPTATSVDFLGQIRQARDRIRDRIFRTPLVRSKRLEQDLNCKRVLLKLECLQITGSFKVRGAMNAVSVAVESGDDVVFATASAGNHGLGLAYSAARFKRDAVVYMPERTPLTKRKAIERYTSNITLKGQTFEEAKDFAEREAERNQYRFIHPYNDELVMAGQGTLGLEIVDDIHDFYRDEPPELVVIPVGGGGLLAGVGTALKHHWPETTIVGAEALNIPSLEAALKEGGPRRVVGERTFADGIAVAEVGDKSFAILREVVNEVWKVSEESMAKAVIRLVEDVRVVAEGAGACGLGGLFDKHASAAAAIANRSVLIVVSGGNLDTVALSKLLQRGLVLARRLAHLRFVAEDVPGALARITHDLAELQVNVLDMWHSRLNAYVRVGTTHIDVIVETRDAAHVDSVREALIAKGHQVEIVTE